MNQRRPEGPSSLGPAQRADCAYPTMVRPAGPRSGRVDRGSGRYDAPLGLTVVGIDDPGCCPVLRDGAPLALNDCSQNRPKRSSPLSPAHRAGLRFSTNPMRPNGPRFLSPGQRPGFASPANIIRPEGPRYGGQRRPNATGENRKSLARLEQGVTELEGMLK